MHHFKGGSNDGAKPYGTLVLNGDMLYGMTKEGGDADFGVIFSIHKDIPEPATLSLLAIGGLALLRRRRS